MTAAAALQHPAARFAAALALGLCASLLLPLSQLRVPKALVSLGARRGAYDHIFQLADGIAKGVDDLAVAWGNTSCSKGIYLDVGSNVGVQVRKLYHPEQFPGAGVLPIFDKLFGPAPRAGVCAVGFEPNPKHTPYLTTLNTWFARRGYPARIFTETAVGPAQGVLPFYGDKNAGPEVHEWGASLAYNEGVQGKNVTVTNVFVMDLSKFFARVVRPILDAEERATGKRPPVAMKMDIEGAEYAVLPGLILSGALCDVNVAFLEWHSNKMAPKGSLDVDRSYMPNAVKVLKQAAPHCRVELSALDDESFADGPAIPLP